MRLVRSVAFASGLGLGVAAMAAMAATVAQPPAAAEPLPALMASLKPGVWHIRMLDGSSEPARDLCVADPRMLVQLRHGGAACSRFVAADEPKVATVSYTCPGSGSGRTSLRLETPVQIRIDSQGIADKAPFAFIAEARRIGDCAAAPASADKPAPMPADRPVPAAAPALSSGIPRPR